jgi:hypothetical protein
MKFNLLYLLLISILYSCNGGNEKTISTIVDTTPNTALSVEVDSVSKKEIEKKLSPIEQEDVKRILKNEKEKEEMSKLYGPEGRLGNEIIVSESKIFYSADFEPYLEVKIKNNLKIPFIAVEVIVHPKSKSSSNCTSIIIKKKINIGAGKMIILNEKIKAESTDCTLDNASVSLGDCIMSNGKKIEMSDLLRSVKGPGD